MRKYFQHLSYFKIKRIYFVLFITLFTFKILFFLDYALQSALYFLKRCSIVFKLLKSICVYSEYKA